MDVSFYFSNPVDQEFAYGFDQIDWRQIPDNDECEKELRPGWYSLELKDLATSKRVRYTKYGYDNEIFDSLPKGDYMITVTSSKLPGPGKNNFALTLYAATQNVTVKDANSLYTMMLEKNSDQIMKKSIQTNLGLRYNFDKNSENLVIEIKNTAKKDLRMHLTYQGKYPRGMKSNVDWKDGSKITYGAIRGDNGWDYFYELEVDCPQTIPTCYYLLSGVKKLEDIIFE